MGDLGRRRDKYRGRVGWFWLGLVPFGPGGFWPASRVPESVGRIGNSVLWPSGLSLGRLQGRHPTLGRGGRGTDKSTLTLS